MVLHPAGHMLYGVGVSRGRSQGVNRGTEPALAFAKLHCGTHDPQIPGAYSKRVYFVFYVGYGLSGAPPPVSSLVWGQVGELLFCILHS